MMFMLRRLDGEHSRRPFVDCKMQGSVQSYDLHQNEKYSRLNQLKSLLDGFKPQQQ